MESRNFQLDTEWNIIHYPDKPKGFGILILGDERHYVDEHSCFWTENKGKSMILEHLKRAGYTVFSSNLYGRHWGSEKATRLAKRLYEFIIRTEILNERIHIIAEGMGALVAIKLLKVMEDDIRSCLFINPVLSLKYYLNQEREKKFYYKKLVKEITNAYEIDEQSLFITGEDEFEQILLTNDKPIKIIQILEGEAYKQERLLNKLSEEWMERNLPITVTYLVPEKKYALSSLILKFFEYYEREL